MKLSDFKIGRLFYMNEKKWLCTDVGTRTVAAICLTDAATITRSGHTIHLSEAQIREWISGPLYALGEECLDEDDLVRERAAIIRPFNREQIVKDSTCKNGASSSDGLKYLCGF